MSEKTRNRSILILLAALIALLVSFYFLSICRVGKPMLHRQDSQRLEAESYSPDSSQHSRNRPRDQRQTSGKSVSDYTREMSEARSKFKGAELTSQLTKITTEASSVLTIEEYKEICAQVKELSVQKYALANLGMMYANLDPVAGIAWLASVSSDSSSTSAFSGFGASVSKTDIPSTLESLKGINNKQCASALIGGIFSSGDIESSKMVIEFLNKNPDLFSKGMQWDLLGNALRKDASPDDVLNTIQSIGNEECKSEAVMAAARILSESYPQKTADYILAQKNEKDQVAATSILLYRWANTDVEAASSWISRLDKGAVRDAATSRMSAILIDTNYSDAMSWAKSVESKKMRDEAIRKVLEAAKDADPTEYQKLVEKSKVD